MGVRAYARIVCDLVARDTPRLTALATKLRESTGRNAEVLAADLTSRDDLRRIEERLRSDASITALVNNAGVGATGKLIDTSVDDLEKMISLNVTALTRLAAAVIPAFLPRANGLIINIASIVHWRPSCSTAPAAAPRRTSSISLRRCTGK